MTLNEGLHGLFHKGQVIQCSQNDLFQGYREVRLVVGGQVLKDLEHQAKAFGFYPESSKESFKQKSEETLAFYYFIVIIYFF